MILTTIWFDCNSIAGCTSKCNHFINIWLEISSDFDIIIWTLRTSDPRQSRFYSLFVNFLLIFFLFRYVLLPCLPFINSFRTPTLCSDMKKECTKPSKTICSSHWHLVYSVYICITASYFQYSPFCDCFFF